MAKKFLTPAIFLCVSIGLGTALFNTRKEVASNTAYPSEQHRSNPTFNIVPEHERITEPGLKNSKQGVPTPKDDVMIVGSPYEMRSNSNLYSDAPGTGGNWLPNTSACSRELSELKKQLTAEASCQRAQGLETLIDLQAPDALPAVVESLGDQDDEVRYRALEKAHVAALVLPPEVLADLVERDNSELVRMMAIEAIGYHPAIHEQDKIALARYAINDLSPAVQTRASEILSHLEYAPLIREQEQVLYDESNQQIFQELPEGNVTE